MNTKKQIEMDFQPGLTEQYRSLQEVCAAAVYGSRKGLGGVAADLDMSPTTLTKVLNKQKDDDNTRNPPWHTVEGIIQSTGDLRPVFYLVEKFCEDPEAKRRRVIAEMDELSQRMRSFLAQERAK